MNHLGSAVIDRYINECTTKGVFRQLKTTEAEGATNYRFGWLSRLQAFSLRYSHKDETLAFKNVFPDITAEVELYLNNLLKRMTGDAVPAHRRIETDKVELALVNNDGSGDLVMKINGDNHEYAIRRLVNLVNEMYQGLQLTHADYSAAVHGGFDE